MLKKPLLIYNKDFVVTSDNYLPTKNRNAMVHSLIEASGLLYKVDVIKPTKASFDQLRSFHSSEYLCFLQESNKFFDDENTQAEYGFGYDCPMKSGLYEYCREVAGGSITAAIYLCRKDYNVVFHWLGGWHHAKMSEAAGYCYVNDCVLAILELRKKFPKVLYIDFDLHHGDGVQDAFAGTNKVFTFSIHKYEPGFFPGSGNVNEIGFGKGKYHNVNIPLHDGIHDDSFMYACKRVLSLIKHKYSPDAVVCQVGVDGLNGDPMRSFNLTSFAFEECVKIITSWGLPTLFLGGGGYHEANSARCWTRLTASIADAPLPEDIPEHDFFPCYGPDFDFKIEKSFKKDLNSKEYLDEIINAVTTNLEKL